MFAVYSCIRNDHDLRLVLLAGLLCLGTALAAVLLLRHAQAAQPRQRARWLAAAGIATGTGIWATHFVAMLGYDTGIAAGYALPLTALSLAIVIAAAAAAFSLALARPGRSGIAGAAALLGGGIAAMHYTGMQAVLFPGHFRFDPLGVVASVLFAILPLAPALTFTLARRSRGSAFGACALVMLAILLLHFTGMASISIIPSRAAETTMLLSPVQLATLVGLGASGLLALLGIAAWSAARTRRTIDARDREFAALVRGIKDCAIYMLDADGRVASWNSGAENLKGYSEEEAIGLPLARFYTEADQAAGAPEAALAAAAANGTHQTEGWRCGKHGTRFWAHVLIEALHDSEGRFAGYAKITRDMTQFKLDQERLAELTRNLDAALSHMHQGLGLFDAEGRLVLANGQVGPTFGLAANAIQPGTSFVEILRVAMQLRDGVVTDAALEEAHLRHRACLALPGGGTLLVPFIDDRTLLVAHRPMADGGWVTTFEDITERRHAEQRIEHMALHDSLTGLANRVKYGQRLDGALATAAQDGAQVAVIGIDLDRFKEINDTHGHTAGDEVLRALAKRLTDTLREGEFVGRFGGDEFSAFKTFSGEAELAGFIQRLESALTAPVVLGELTVSPGASLGVAVFPQDGGDAEQLARNADLAMYRAKGNINCHTCFYEQGMDQAVRARRMLSHDLKGAEMRGELSLAYQVQRSVTSQEVVGYEALLRWNHPVAGPIPPDQFIPIAEESGEIVRIGEWVLRTACAKAAGWPQPWRVAVNLSPVQLMHVELVEVVAQTLIDTGLPARRLELEITETALIGDKARALHVLRQIKALGVSIAIDDFGTGYSSLDTLHSFPFDKIKIDKSFLLESARSEQARAIIRAVLALGQSLRLPVLAEGLESAEQLDLLRHEGCDEAQGYYFGRPSPMPDTSEPRQEAAPAEASVPEPRSHRA